MPLLHASAACATGTAKAVGAAILPASKAVAQAA